MLLSCHLTMQDKIKWWASGGHVAVSGPFESQEDAFSAFRYTKREAIRNGTPFPSNLVTWCSAVDEHQAWAELNNDRG